MMMDWLASPGTDCRPDLLNWAEGVKKRIHKFIFKDFTAFEERLMAILAQHVLVEPESEPIFTEVDWDHPALDFIGGKHE